MTKNKGWVKFWREQFGSWISKRKPWCDGYAWTYIYSQANFKDGVVNFRNQYIPVKRGQFLTSERGLGMVFGWARKRTKSFLFALETDEMCYIRRGHRFTLITIRNYVKYQSTPDDKETTEVTTEGTTEGTGGRPQGDHRETSESCKPAPDVSLRAPKNVKKEKNEKKKESNPPLTPPKGGVEIPEWIKPEVWKDFLEHRKGFKPKFTEHAQELALAKLGRFRDAGFNPEEIINESIISGWKGLFMPKGTKHKEGGISNDREQDLPIGADGQPYPVDFIAIPDDPGSRVE